MKLADSPRTKPNHLYKISPLFLFLHLFISSAVLFVSVPPSNQSLTLSLPPKLQNSIRGTFLLDNGVDLSFQAPCKWVKPISCSSSWYIAVDSQFHLYSEHRHLITPVKCVVSMRRVSVVSPFCPVLSAVRSSSHVPHRAPVEGLFRPHAQFHIINYAIVIFKFSV